MKIKKENLKDLYPLTPMQEGMLFHALRDPASSAYTEQVVWRVRGKLDMGLFQSAWDHIHGRYDALRSVFTPGKTKQPLQLVLKERACDFSFELLVQHTSEEQDAIAARVREEEKTTPFDLTAGPLLRVRVFEFADDRFEIILTWHHILLDGWSTHMMLGDLFQIYAGLVDGRVPELPPIPPYAGYIDWLKARNVEGSLGYWRDLLLGFETATEMPRLLAEADSYSLRRQSVMLESDFTVKLNQFAAGRGATLNSVVQAAWGILLARYNDVGDAVFGAVVSGRSPEVPEIERLPGLLINTVPVRVAFDGTDSFTQILERTQRQNVESQGHHTCRLADIQAETELKSDLIKTLLIFENYPIAKRAGGSGELDIEVVETSEPTHYEMILLVDPGAGIRFELQYNGSVYPDSFAERIIGRLVRLLRVALAEPDTPVADLDLLEPSEREQLEHSWNATRREYPRDSNLAEVFRGIVERHGDRNAVSSRSGSLTYSELDQRVNHLAGYLGAKGVVGGDRVALVLGRSMEMIEAILAVIRLGAVYVPIAPETPTEQLEFILADAEIKLVITKVAVELRLKDIDCVRIDAESEREQIAKCTGPEIASDLGPLGEAYLIYTSGSTGQPKAVRVSHRSVLRLTCNSDYVTLTPEDRVAHMSHVAFDAATFEIWGALLNGATLHILEKETALTPHALEEELRDRKITTLFITTALFNQIAREAPTAFATLDNLLFGGELVDLGWVRRVLERGAPKRLLHVYGPTETTTFATWFLVESANRWRTIPIGQPIANTTAHVLSRWGKLQPVGATGELYIGGDGVALGYLNRPGLTGNSFVPNPMNSEETIYRSGDLVRRNLDGDIEFIGRRDNQVKLRGFRIELGEIETALRAIDTVDDALVLVKADSGGGGRKLIAYLTTNGSTNKNVDVLLRKSLKDSLHRHMIPSAFVILEAFPINANGKIDRGALPEPTRAGTGFGRTHVAPVGELEKSLAGIWKTVLGVTDIGRNDNFFELGGHSLTATTTISHIRAELKIDIPLAFFFECPSLEALGVEVATLQEQGRTSTSAISRVSREAYRASGSIHKQQ